MKAYVVTLLNIEKSVNVANRCVQSGKKYGIEVELFPAVYKDVAFEEMQQEQLQLAKFDQSYSCIEAVVGNFVAQYRIWKKVSKANEPAIVLEHDAVFISPIPTLVGLGDIINLGKPSYGKFNTPANNIPGVYPMFSKDGGYIPGAHGYYITPAGANGLVTKAKQLGVSPCDIFLNNKNFPEIKECYPWPIEAHDSFTTIQTEKGCKAKHNYNKEYQIL